MLLSSAKNLFWLSQNHSLVMCSFLLWILSLVFFFLKSNKNQLFISILLLTGASACISVWAITRDDFINLWDEQFHAMVAKNLVKNPIFPTLLPFPVIDYDFKNWTANYVWVHKQPLYLWQMALCIKFFGYSEFIIRLPSVIAHTLLTPLIFRIGYNHFNPKTAFLASTLFTFSPYSLELVSGRLFTDHNDFIFLFYIVLSFWALSEYLISKKKIWLYAMAIFSGLAVLVKWLVGLLVYLAYAITELPTVKEYLSTPKKIILPLSLFFITCFVFVPWQVYIFSRFPTEAAYEYKMAALHFTEVIEGHSGTWKFHLQQLNTLYTSVIPYGWVLIIFIGGALLSIRFASNNANKLFMMATFACTLFVYLFFSIAKSKLSGFCLPVSFAFYLFISSFFTLWLSLVKTKINVYLKNGLYASVCIALFLLNYNLTEFEYLHNDNGINAYNRDIRRKDKHAAKKIKHQFPDKLIAVYNFGKEPFANVNGMIYSDKPCFDFYPTSEMINQTIKNNYLPVVLADSSLPTYLQGDSRVLILEKSNYY